MEDSKERGRIQNGLTFSSDFLSISYVPDTGFTGWTSPAACQLHWRWRGAGLGGGEGWGEQWGLEDR